jgi:uncharacterized protein (DUF1330 family)
MVAYRQCNTIRVFDQPQDSSLFRRNPEQPRRPLINRFPPTRSSMFALTLTLALAQAPAAGAIRIADYLPSHVSDRWQYQNMTKDGMPIIVVGVPDETTFGGVPVHRRTENNGDHRYQTIDANGVRVHHLYFIGGRTIEYPSPMTLAPGVVEVGGTYRARGPYISKQGGGVVERGEQTYETFVEGFGDTTSPLGTWKDCLITVTKALRVDESGGQKGYELREWNAKGVGGVRIEGEIYWLDKAGKKTRSFRVGGLLEGARVAGKAVSASVSVVPPCDKPVFMVVQSDIADRAKLAAYGQALRDSGLYSDHVGYYAASGRPVEVFEGAYPENRTLIIAKFPCLANARAFWDSERYAKIKTMREGAGTFSVAVYDEKEAPDYVKRPVAK